MWQDECGAQAMPLTHARWLFNLATGVQGTRTSRITTCRKNKKPRWVTGKKKPRYYTREKKCVHITCSSVDLKDLRDRGVPKVTIRLRKKRQRHGSFIVCIISHMGLLGCRGGGAGNTNVNNPPHAIRCMCSEFCACSAGQMRALSPEPQSKI